MSITTHTCTDCGKELAFDENTRCMTCSNKAKFAKNAEQTALLPIDPKREALAQAARLLRNHWQELRSQYKYCPAQLGDLESAFNDIVRDLEYQIVEIDTNSL